MCAGFVRAASDANSTHRFVFVWNTLNTYMIQAWGIFG